MWLVWAMVCLLAAPWVQLSVSAGSGWPHSALRHHWLMPISCHFRDCKALLVTSLAHVSGAIASVQTFISMCVHQIKSAVLGHNGSRLRHVQLESGAAISVDDARPFHCTVSITGSQEQINNARLLLRMWYVYTFSSYCAGGS